MSRKPWTAADLAALRALYPDTRTDALAEQMGRSTGQIYGMARQINIRKSPAYLASADACRMRRGDNVGEAHRFPTGHTPANKGLRRPGWTAGRMAESQFKTGNRSGRAAQIYQPIGTERISKDGYLERKTNDNMPLQKRWRGVHLLMWEAINGPLPPGHCLVFINRDRSDIRLDNLQLITRRENMLRNTVHNLPQPIVETVRLRAVLVRKINQATKKAEP